MWVRRRTRSSVTRVGSLGLVCGWLGTNAWGMSALMPQTSATAPAARTPSGLREAHCHIGAFGAALSLPSVSECASLGECLARVTALCAVAKPGQHVRALHARPLAWPEGRWPTLAELDAAAGAAPVVIMSFDHHQGVCNSAMLAAAGLSAGQRVGPKGEVVSDAHGVATGLLMEHAAYAAWEASPAPSVEESLSHLRAGLRRYLELGFIEVHDLRTDLRLAEALVAMDLSGELAGELGMRVELFPLVQDLGPIVELVQTLRPARVRVAGGKLFADGTLNARTALTLTPYAEALPGLPMGQAMVTPSQVDEALRACDALGLPLAVHAIGDGAVRMILDALARVRPVAMGQRIEHCELIDPADVPRFAELGVTASVQPCHLLTDVPALTRLLPQSLGRVLPVRSLIASGLTPGALVRGVVFGSDAPIVRPEPIDSIVGATRGGATGSASAVAGLDRLSPGEAIDEATAWRCFEPG